MTVQLLLMLMFQQLFLGNSAWYPVILSSSVPNTITRIRIRKTLANANGYRIDDIEIIKP